MGGDIVFTGLISHDSLKQLNGQSDVLVITSAHEGFYLGYGEEIFDFPNHEHLAANLSELFSKPSLTQQLSMAGQRAVLLSYDNFARNIKDLVGA